MRVCFMIRSLPCSSALPLHFELARRASAAGVLVGGEKPARFELIPSTSSAETQASCHGGGTPRADEGIRKRAPARESPELRRRDPQTRDRIRVGLLGGEAGVALQRRLPAR